MKQRVKDLRDQGDKLFTKRLPLISLWQTTAENFYPERGDFTRPNRSIGEEFASHLMTGRPVLARRDLANSLSSILRPTSQPWFFARTDNEDINETQAAQQWLDMASQRMRRVMYDKKAQFVRATKQGDNDFAAFGQCIIKVDFNRNFDGLLYRTRHLRDVAWQENAELEIDTVHDKWKLDVRSLVKLFPKTVAPQVSRLVDKEPFREIDCRCIVIPADEYDLKKTRGMPFVQLYVDIENDVILEEIPAAELDYVIPRWVTVSGSQYAYSPATVIALPDARMLQQMGLTLLEAGQKAVDPPLVAKGEAIAGAVNTFAGGTTWVDPDYDENDGEALRVLEGTEQHNFQFGIEREQKIEQFIAEAFYLNQIRFPDVGGPEKTAYQVQQEVEEYLRRARPLFEPMETEYNGGLCEKTFSKMLRAGAFGSPQDMPPVLAGQNVRFQFESPLQGAADRAKASAFQQASQLLATAMQIDENVRYDFDVDTAFRDALAATGAPPKWIVPEQQAAMAKQQAQQVQAAQAQQQAVAGAADTVGKVADAAHRGTNAAQAMQQAGIM